MALKKAGELRTMQETADSKTAASRQPAHEANAARLDALLSAAQKDFRNDPEIPDGIDDPDRQAERTLEPAALSTRTDYFANRSTDATDVNEGRPSHSGTKPRTPLGPKVPRGVRTQLLAPVAAVAIFVAAGTGVYLYGETAWTIVEELPREQSNAMVSREKPGFQRTGEMDARQPKRFGRSRTILRVAPRVAGILPELIALCGST
ncbi:MAG: hypothetical protein PVG24_11215, partial [Gammaproteobacteria bacterium]